MSGLSLFDEETEPDAPGAWVERPFLCLDFETTGTDPFLARPVSVAAVLLGPDGWTEGDTLIVDAGVDIPESAAAIHGITEECVAEEGVAAIEVCRYLAARVQVAEQERRPVVMFNARFDWTLLKAEFSRYDTELPDCRIIDPFVIDRHLDKYRRGKRTLISVADHYDVRLDDAHAALADALATGEIARVLARTRLSHLSLDEMHAQQAAWYESWRVGFNDYLRRKGDMETVTPGWPLAIGAA
jgi:DNA polymerase-3 subunit epsilon